MSILESLNNEARGVMTMWWRSMPLIILMTATPVFANPVVAPCEQNTDRSLFSRIFSTRIDRDKINTGDDCNPIQELNIAYSKNQLADSDYRIRVETLMTSNKQTDNTRILDRTRLRDKPVTIKHSDNETIKKPKATGGFRTIGG
mgnify:CR=1 FL=1